jgi:hypothetical protein
MIASGASNAGVAHALSLSRQTVDYHLDRLHTALGASTRAALVARAFAIGTLARTLGRRGPAPDIRESGTRRFRRGH